MSNQQNFSSSFAAFKKTQQYSFLRSDEEIGLMQRASDSISTFSVGIGLGTRNPDAECFGVSTIQRYIGFGIVMVTSALFFMISLFTLPMVLLSPGKFALTYSTASLLFLGSFAILNGWRAHLKHLFCKERGLFTAIYLLSNMGTLYYAVIKPRYIGIILFTVMQMIALVWYLFSYLPGGTNGLKWIARGTGLPI